MANKNKTECNCMGIYNAALNGCDPVPEGIDPCPPTFWQNAAGWDWANISDVGLEWGYALGLLNRPDTTDTAIYTMELERQTRQSMYIMVGLGIIALIIVLAIMKKRK